MSKESKKEISTALSPVARSKAFELLDHTHHMGKLQRYATVLATVGNEIPDSFVADVFMGMDTVLLEKQKKNGDKVVGQETDDKAHSFGKGKMLPFSMGEVSPVDLANTFSATRLDEKAYALDKIAYHVAEESMPVLGSRDVSDKERVAPDISKTATEGSEIESMTTPFRTLDAKGKVSHEGRLVEIMEMQLDRHNADVLFGLKQIANRVGEKLRDQANGQSSIPRIEAVLDFIRASHEFNKIKLLGVMPGHTRDSEQYFASTDDLRVVMYADGLLGRHFQGRYISNLEGVSTSHKLDLLDKARKNFTLTMSNWSKLRR